MTSDLDEQLGYDADHDDPSQFCEHGTFIGSFWGPDYLCHWCEAGVSVEEMRESLHRSTAATSRTRSPSGRSVPASTRQQAIHQLRSRLVPLADVSDLFNTMPAHDRVRLIVHCVPWVMEHYGPTYDRLIELGGDLCTA